MNLLIVLKTMGENSGHLDEIFDDYIIPYSQIGHPLDEINITKEQPIFLRGKLFFKPNKASSF